LEKQQTLISQTLIKTNWTKKPTITTSDEHVNHYTNKAVKGLTLWFQQYFNYIMAVSFIGEETGGLGENH